MQIMFIFFIVILCSLLLYDATGYLDESDHIAPIRGRGEYIGGCNNRDGDEIEGGRKYIRHTPHTSLTSHKRYPVQHGGNHPASTASTSSTASIED